MPATDRAITRPGRPAADPVLKKVPVGYKLPAWLVDWLRGQDRPAAQLIEEALRKQHDLNPPERKPDHG
ncbi:MAG: hypothetical protein PHO55_11170 [Thiomonas arsenitoxydans]|jgi:hypothetical protein|nr:hypothetical protein [Thiomonas arsenitoxydans]